VIFAFKVNRWESILQLTPDVEIVNLPFLCLIIAMNSNEGFDISFHQWYEQKLFFRVLCSL
jgi:hypothetical protein